MRKLTILYTLLALVSASICHAEESSIDLCLQGRGSFLATGSANGFKGDYLNLCLGGSVGENFTFYFRQRLNKPVYADDLSLRPTICG